MALAERVYPDWIKTVEARALEISADIARKSGAYRAEILPNTSPIWHLVETVPNQERKAVRFLADRGFGVFLPRFSNASLHHLQALGLHETSPLIFPGRLFVYVWDVLAHWRRIAHCPGVKRIVCNEHERPLVARDALIDEVRMLQVAFGGDVEEAFVPIAQAGSVAGCALAPRRRGKRKRRKLRKRYKPANGTGVGLGLLGDGSGIPLDGAGRNGALLRTLGSGSQLA